MEDTITNVYLIEQLSESFSFEKIEEVKKILSIHKNSYKASREFIIKNNNYCADDKILYIEIIEKLFNINVKHKINTTNYEGRAYSLFFIRDFLAFLRSKDNSFSSREMKLLLAIYEIISEANGISNCLLSCNKQYLAEKAGIDFSNLSKIIKSLQNKGVLKIDNRGSMYLNYKFVFMGNSINYDLYKVQYDNI